MPSKTGYIVFFSILLFSSVSRSHANTSERIKAVSEFLLDRFQANYVYMIEQGMRENAVFKCYFPNTYQYIRDYELSVLLMGGDDIWQASVNMDIENILANTEARLVYSGIRRLAAELSDSYSFLHLLKMMEIEGGTAGTYELLYTKKVHKNKSFYDALKNLSDAYNMLMKYNNYFDGCKFSDEAVDSGKKASWFYTLASEERERKIAEKEVVAAMTELNQVVNSIKSLVKAEKIRFVEDYNYLRSRLSLSAFGKELADSEARALKYITEKKFSNTERLQFFKQDFDKLIGLSDFIRNKLEQLQRVPKVLAEVKVGGNAAKTGKNLLRVIEAERIIREYVSRKMGGTRVSVNSKEYREFKRYIIFFAQLSQVSNGEDAALLLKNALLPPVSFGTKRKSGEAHLLVTAYLGGAAYGEDDRATDTDKEDVQYASLIAPLGLEYSVGIGDGGSVSFMLAPFDFAYPITLESQDSDKEVEFSDIVVPGVYFSYGFAEKPIAVGIGISRGKPLRSDTGREERIMLFIAMDMPLFQLY